MTHKQKKQSTGSSSSGSANYNKHTKAMGHGSGKVKCPTCRGKKGHWEKMFFSKEKVWIACMTCDGRGYVQR